MPKLNAFNTIIANHTTPHGVVKVKNQALFELSFDGANDIHHSGGYIRQCVNA